jgi:hypothetical protein
MEDGWEGPGPDDLLIDGEAVEVLLELLMRGEFGPTSSEASQPAKDGKNPKGKTTPAKGKEKKKAKKEALKESRRETAQSEGGRTGAQKKKETSTGRVGEPRGAAAPDPLTNPEARNRGLISDDRPAEEPESRSTTTSRGECSGQKKPDS